MSSGRQVRRQSVGKAISHLLPCDAVELLMPEGEEQPALRREEEYEQRDQGCEVAEERLHDVDMVI